MKIACYSKSPTNGTLRTSGIGLFKLPYSGLSGPLASQLHQQSWPEDHRIWIPPDVPVGLTSEEFFAGRDPALEAITHLIAAESR